VYQPNRQLQQNVDHHTLENLEDPADLEVRVVLGAPEDPVDPVAPQLLNLVYQLNQPSQQRNQADQEVQAVQAVQEVREALGDPLVPEVPVGPVVRVGLEVPVDQEGQVWLMFVLKFYENCGNLTSVHELGLLHMTPTLLQKSSSESKTCTILRTLFLTVL